MLLVNIFHSMKPRSATKINVRCTVCVQGVMERILTSHPLLIVFSPVVFAHVTSYFDLFTC